MKCKITVFLAFIIAASPAFSQMGETDPVSKKEISKLTFLVGEWAGTGWMMGRDGEKHTFDQTELIQFKLDSTAILIEGAGKSEGKVIHNAMAVVSYNKEENRYDFHSFLANGRKGAFKAELIDNAFYWYPNENMRYIIVQNEKGEWFEKGEMNRNEQWFQFFEMTLVKK